MVAGTRRAAARPTRARSVHPRPRGPGAAVAVIGAATAAVLLRRPAAERLVAVAAATFGLLARTRRRRALHPVGVGFSGRLDIPREHAAGLRSLLPAGSHEATVRFSRGAGLPEPLPDALGIAVKLPRVHGREGDQDFLLTSSADLPLVRRILFPVRSFLGHAFSTALPYHSARGRGVFLLRPTADARRAGAPGFAGLRAAALAGRLAYELRWGRSTGRSELVGVLSVGAELPEPATEALEFDPWVTGSAIRPVGWINRLRGPSYRSSQAARRPSMPRG